MLAVCPISEFQETDQSTLTDLREGHTYEHGELNFHGDCTRGRRLKTRIAINPRWDRHPGYDRPWELRTALARSDQGQEDHQCRRRRVIVPVHSNTLLSRQRISRSPLPVLGFVRTSKPCARLLRECRDVHAGPNERYSFPGGGRVCTARICAGGGAGWFGPSDSLLGRLWARQQR